MATQDSRFSLPTKCGGALRWILSSPQITSSGSVPVTKGCTGGLDYVFYLKTTWCWRTKECIFSPQTFQLAIRHCHPSPGTALKPTLQASPCTTDFQPRRTMISPMAREEGKQPAASASTSKATVNTKNLMPCSLFSCLNFIHYILVHNT